MAHRQIGLGIKGILYVSQKQLPENIARALCDN